MHLKIHTGEYLKVASPDISGGSNTSPTRHPHLLLVMKPHREALSQLGQLAYAGKKDQTQWHLRETVRGGGDALSWSNLNQQPISWFSKVCRKGTLLNQCRHTIVDAMADHQAPGGNCHLLSVHSGEPVGLGWRKLLCSRWRPSPGEAHTQCLVKAEDKRELPLSARSLKGAGSAPAGLSFDSPELQFSMSPVSLIPRAPALCPGPKRRHSHNWNAKF